MAEPTPATGPTEIKEEAVIGPACNGCGKPIANTVLHIVASVGLNTSNGRASAMMAGERFHNGDCLAARVLGLSKKVIT